MPSMKKPASHHQKQFRTAQKAKVGERAPAWVSGGSSAHPRVGKPFSGSLKTLRKEGVRSAQHCSKRGTKLLIQRGKASTAPRAYTPVHQKISNDKQDMRNVAAASKLKTTDILKWSPCRLVSELTKSGHLIRFRQCPKCKVGKVRKLAVRNKLDVPFYRCSAKKCQRRFAPHHEHPIFSNVRGSSHIPLKLQALIMHAIVWNMPTPNIILLDHGISKKIVESMRSRWRQLVRDWVVERQKTIKFGSLPAMAADGMELAPLKLDEIEADAATFRKIDCNNGEVNWLEYDGLKRRGDRTSLVLERNTNSRSSRTEHGTAAPPPTSKARWGVLRKKYCRRGTLVHTDGAPAYKHNPEGVFHDAVSHSSRGWRKKGIFTKPVSHQLPDGSNLKTVGGTQMIDGWWRHGKRAVSSINARYPNAIDIKLREAQWRHWIGQRDPWIEAGKVISGTH